MDETSNRTFVCSVLFLDIVEYSKKSVTEQLKLKQRFNSLLIRALQHVATSDRIVLDTGDGAAVCFLGSPEVAMFVAMDLRDGIASESPDESPLLQVRMGANLGPIRLIKDINGQLNIIGDGINVAQRVMSFATASTILVSRPFYEVVSRLSDDYAQILRYDGSRTDKHVREHEVYVLGQTIPHKYREQSAESHAPQSPEQFVAAPMAAAGGGDSDVARVAAPATAPASATKGSGATHSVVTTLGVSRKLLTGVCALALAIVGGAVMLRMQTGTNAHLSSSATSDTESPEVGASDAPKRVAPAKLTLVIIPWGEVYVDGEKRGISPPLKSLDLAPGTYTVEIRNTSFPVHTEKIDAKSGVQLKIRHRF